MANRPLETIQFKQSLSPTHAQMRERDVAMLANRACVLLRGLTTVES